VFSEVPPEPTEDHVRRGIDALRRTEADTIIAIGGGSVLDAAKAIRLFAESPQLTLRELALPFLDARKRVAEYPQLEHRVKLIAVPTTAGTGSEVSPAAVVSVGPRKVTLVDYSLVPDVAIVDPTFTMTMPPALTADTGVDALTHALEALVSIFASPYTDAFCLQALHLILDNLPRAYADGTDVEARTAMANAATIAGLAFSNAFVGVNHALAHALGARFKVPHGRANGIFLMHTLRYNSEIPSKFSPAPGYTTYVAPAKLAQAAWVLGLGGGHSSDEQRRERLFERIESLLRTVGIPRTLAEAGISQTEYRAAREELTRAAFTDPSLRTNPRIPMMRELQALFDAAWA
jgi:acetaldehyde dehydrogenase/alcohol dehydrogenase